MYSSNPVQAQGVNRSLPARTLGDRYTGSCSGGCLPRLLLCLGLWSCFHIPRKLGKRGGEHFSYQEIKFCDGPLVCLVRGTCGTSLMLSGRSRVQLQLCPL